MKEIERLTLDGEEVNLKEYAKRSEIIELKAQGLQQTPLFANSVEECTDTTKMYVLPDGNIYYYSDGSEAAALYTNKIPLSVNDDGGIYNGVGYKKGVRYATSSAAEKDYERAYITGWIHVYDGDVIRLKNMPISTLDSADAMTNAIYMSNENKTTQWTVYSTIIQENITDCEVDDDGNVSQFTVQPGTNWIRFASTQIDETSIVTVNEEIASSGALEKGWHNSGHAFVPADYEDRIAALENAMKNTVYGIVDEDNTILLAGGLSSGTYKLKYQNDNGTASEIGSITVG